MPPSATVTTGSRSVAVVFPTAATTAGAVEDNRQICGTIHATTTATTGAQSGVSVITAMAALSGLVVGASHSC